MTFGRGAHVVVRADASIDLGAGHISRCLTLADALGRIGARCTFLMRRVPGAMDGAVQDRGHGLAWLDGAADADADQRESSAWLAAALPDLVIVDHYGLDARWEKMAASTGAAVLAIDDLADRPHDVDFLLDQNLGRRAEDYAGWLPDRARTFIGPQFALLRPQFADARIAALRRRAGAPLRRVLVSVGGVDRDNMTAFALLGLAEFGDPSIEIDVVLGAHSPWRADIQSMCDSIGPRARLHTAVADMAALMAGADLAIGAGGGTAWERCCLGLPSIIVVVAENQRPGAYALAEAGAALVIGDAGAKPPAIAEAIRSCVSPESRARMSAAAAAVCDGRGASRLVESLASMSGRGRIRLMTVDDLGHVRAWRNDPAVRRVMFTTHEISPSEHADWFARASTDPSRRLLIFEDAGVPVGYVQLTGVSRDGVADWGFYAAPDTPKGTGRRLGTAALDYAFEIEGVAKVCGQALSFNEASIGFHLALGFADEGVRTEPQIVDGVPYAVRCFGLRRDEWRARRGL